MAPKPLHYQLDISTPEGTRVFLNAVGWPAVRRMTNKYPDDTVIQVRLVNAGMTYTYYKEAGKLRLA